MERRVVREALQEEGGGGGAASRESNCLVGQPFFEMSIGDES